MPNYNTVSVLLNRDDFLFNEPPQHLNYFTPSTLRRLLQVAPLRDVTITTGGGLKWEKIVGRAVTSDIKAVYDRANPQQQGHPECKGTESASVIGAIKRLRPLQRSSGQSCTDRLKLGMALAATARRA